MDFDVRCSCGTVKLHAEGVSPGLSNHVVCYCSTCQAFAHYLGRGAELLDDNGGSDIFQMSSGRLRIGGGAEALTCVRITEDGPLRWYADCCKSPIGNTHANWKHPFIGLLTSAMDVTDAERKNITGPIRFAAFKDHATGRTHLAEGTHSLRATIARFYKILLIARLKGDHKRSPFFDASHNPIAVPKSDERADD